MGLCLHIRKKFEKLKKNGKKKNMICHIVFFLHPILLPHNRWLFDAHFKTL